MNTTAQKPNAHAWHAWTEAHIYFAFFIAIRRALRVVVASAHVKGFRDECAYVLKLVDCAVSVARQAVRSGDPAMLVKTHFFRVDFLPVLAGIFYSHMLFCLCALEEAHYVYGVGVACEEIKRCVIDGTPFPKIVAWQLTAMRTFFHVAPEAMQAHGVCRRLWVAEIFVREFCLSILDRAEERNAERGNA